LKLAARSDVLGAADDAGKCNQLAVLQAGDGIDKWTSQDRRPRRADELAVKLSEGPFRKK